MDNHRKGPHEEGRSEAGQATLRASTNIEANREFHNGRSEAGQAAPRAFTNKEAIGEFDDNAEDDHGSDDKDEDEDDASGNIERYHVSKLKTSKPFIATQEFRCPRLADRSEGDRESNRASDRAKDYTPFDPSSVKYRGRVFRKNRCYVTVRSEGEVAVGIEHFLPNDTARCILVQRFEDTLLGIEDEGSEYEADGSVKGTHSYKNLPLSKLGRECEDVAEIPRLIYQPQSDGDWHTFGYFYDRTRMRRKGKRQGMRSLELFAGAGGSLLGYKHRGFEAVMAVENNADAVRTLKENNEGINVYEGCIKQFLRDYDTDRADLSLLMIDLVEKTSCSTVVFESVVGIWHRKNIHYLKNIAAGLMKLGYQVRCTELEACDYGDPQKWPRVIMIVSKNAVPIPSFPAKTYGEDPSLFPYVTVKDALSSVSGDGSLPNLEGRATLLRPGQHGSFRLMQNDVKEGMARMAGLWDATDVAVEDGEEKREPSSPARSAKRAAKSDANNEANAKKSKARPQQSVRRRKSPECPKEKVPAPLCSVKTVGAKTENAGTKAFPLYKVGMSTNLNELHGLYYDVCLEDGEVKRTDSTNISLTNPDEEGPVHAPSPSLRSLFEVPKHLMHVAGGFQGARDSAQEERKWLLVNVQREDNFASHALNRDVWRDELVVNLVQDGFILWQTMRNSIEAQTYVTQYKCEGIPTS
ncbi:hypothetical protein ACHAWF_017393 [Thalassiosira exigua]